MDDSEGIPKVQQVICVFDISEGVVNIGQAADALYWSATQCRNIQGNSSEDEKEVCATQISNVPTLFFGFISSFLSAGAGDCSQTVSVAAYCAADVTDVLGNLANLAYCGSSLSQSCAYVPAYYQEQQQEQRLALQADGGQRRLEAKERQRLYEALKAEHGQKAPQGRKVDAAYAQFKQRQKEWKAKIHRLASNREETPTKKILRSSLPKMHFYPRRLACDNATSTVPPSTTTLDPLSVLQEQLQVMNDRKVELADCVFDVADALNYIMAAGLALDLGVTDCMQVSDEIEEDTGESTREICVVDMMGFIESLAWVVSSMSYAIDQCPEAVVLDATCSGDVAAVVASVADIATTGVSLTLTCDKWSHQEQMAEVVNVHPSRLLQSSDSAGLLV